MNLGRAKLILIFAFIGLNLFLAYHLFWPDFGRLTNVAVTAEDLGAMESMLAEYNYILGTTVERSIKTSDFIIVSSDQVFLKTLLERYLRQGARFDRTEDTTYYHLEDETVTVYANGLIHVHFREGAYPLDIPSGSDERTLRNAVKEFLSAHAFLPEGINYDYLEKYGDGEFILYYHRVYNDMPVYSSRFKVIITDSEVEALEIYWLEPTERYPARNITVISAADALQGLIRTIGPSAEKRQIEQIELGFFSGEYDAEKWEIPPVWRIRFDDRSHFYINAFTGNIEQDSVIPDQISDKERSLWKNL